MWLWQARKVGMNGRWWSALWVRAVASRCSVTVPQIFPWWEPSSLPNTKPHSLLWRGLEAHICALLGRWLTLWFPKELCLIYVVREFMQPCWREIQQWPFKDWTMPMLHDSAAWLPGIYQKKKISWHVLRFMNIVVLQSVRWNYYTAQWKIVHIHSIK